MKERGVFLAFAILAVSAIVCASAADVSLSDIYGPDEILTGTITLNYSNISGDGYFSAKFGEATQMITLLNFLKNANAAYTCNPSSCMESYTIASPSQEKTINGDNIITDNYLGLMITGSNINVKMLKFNITGYGSSSSCGFYPTTVDILNDDNVDWGYSNFSNTPCNVFAPSPTYSRQYAVAEYSLTDTDYCEKMELITSEQYRLGIEVNSTLDQEIWMSIIDSSDFTNYASCSVNETNYIYDGSTKIYYCDTKFPAKEKKDYYVCARLNQYSEYPPVIKSETTAPTCGKKGYEEFSCGSSDIDYGLYAQPFFFRPFTNEEEIDFSIDTLQAYLDSKYNSNCTSGCIIPLKINSNQQVKFSGLTFRYEDAAGEKVRRDFYTAQKNSPKVSIDSQTLSLEPARFRTPVFYGNITLSILLNDELLAKKDILLEKVPSIKAVTPTLAFAETKTRFLVYAESPKGNNITEYTWNFGDGSSDEKTTEPVVSHTYKLGTYTLTVSAKDNEGLTGKKGFVISAKEPKEAVNKTYEDKKNALTELKNVTRLIPTVYQSIVKKGVNVDELEETLKDIEEDMKALEPDYTNIQIRLNELKIPHTMKEDRIETLVHNTPLPEYISSVEGTEISDSETMSQKMNIWQKANTEIRVYFIKRQLVNDDSSIDLMTEYKLEISDKYSEKIYLVIIPPVPTSEMVFNEAYSGYKPKDINDGRVFTFEQDSIIEFAVPGNHPVEDFTIFISPETSSLSDGNEDIVCGDGTCDKAQGESFEECPEDCKKPYGKATTYAIEIILGVALGMFIIWKYYAILYDRRLKAKLFKMENDFFNITFYIANEMNKGKKEKEIKDGLKNAGWTLSQIEYATQKVKQHTKRMQKQSVLNFVEVGLKKGKSKEDITKELEDAGWDHSMVKWALRKAEK